MNQKNLQTPQTLQEGIWILNSHLKDNYQVLSLLCKRTQGDHQGMHEGGMWAVRDPGTHAAHVAISFAETTIQPLAHARTNAVCLTASRCGLGPCPSHGLTQWAFEGRSLIKHARWQCWGRRTISNGRKRRYRWQIKRLVAFYA